MKQGHDNISFNGLQEPPNRYLLDLSTLNEGNEGMVDESSICTMTKMGRSSRGQKIRRKFNRHMQFFLAQGGSCSYDDETKGDIKVPLRYTHLQKEWVPKVLPPINTIFFVNERICHIVKSPLHGLGLFSMDGIKVNYKKVIELMEYVGPYYNYNNWMQIVQ